MSNNNNDNNNTTSLGEELEATKTAFLANVPESAKTIMINGNAPVEPLIPKVTRSGQLPSVVLPDAEGKTVDLNALAKAKGLLVIVFYRGSWCPYCNVQLNYYKKRLADIEAAGGHVVAISPMTPDASLSLKEKSELPYTVLSDAGNAFAAKLNLVHTLPNDVKELYQSYKLDVAGVNGDDSWTLPIPATYIVNKDNEIVHAGGIGADYTKREDVDEIIAKLKEFK